MVRCIISILLAKIQSLVNNNSLTARIMCSKVDKTAAIRNRVRFYYSSIGRYSFIGRNSLVQNTQIGNFCSISENCYLGLPTHRMDLVSTSPVFLEGRNVLHKNIAFIHDEKDPVTIIGNDVWMGTGVMVKSGIRIADGAIIAAGAVITHDVPPYAVVAGVPGKIIRYRYDEATKQKLLSSEWWNKTDDVLFKVGEKADEIRSFLEGIVE